MSPTSGIINGGFFLTMPILLFFVQLVLLCASIYLIILLCQLVKKTMKAIDIYINKNKIE